MNVSGGAVGVGLAELADSQGCSSADYPVSSWVGLYSASCKGDFLTFYTALPSGTSSAINSIMSINHAYEFAVSPNAATNVSSRCGQLEIEGLLILLFCLFILNIRRNNKSRCWNI